MDKYSFWSAKYWTHNIILSNIWENKLVLDVWCNKWYIWYNSSNSNTFYWLEYDNNALKEAEKFYKNVKQYDLNNLVDLDFEVDKFDVIIFADVLEHLLFPEKVLEFFKKYLKDDWYIIVSLPNVANWQIRINLLFWKFDYTETWIMDKTHLHFYTFKSAKQIIKSTWFTIKKIYWWASFFWPIIKLFPFFRSILSTNIIFILKK